MSRPAIIASASELLGIWPDLDDVAVIGLDLRDVPLDWSAARVRSTLFLGCLLPDGESDRLGRGARSCSRGSATLRSIRTERTSTPTTSSWRATSAALARRSMRRSGRGSPTRRRRCTMPSCARCTTRRSMRRSRVTSRTAESSESWAGTRSRVTPIGSGASPSSGARSPGPGSPSPRAAGPA